MAKSKVEIRTEVKESAVAMLMPAMPNAVKIDDYTYAIPMGTAEDNGNQLYAKIEVSAPNWYSTKNTPAFNLQDKVALYEAELEERARKAVEKAAAKKEK